MNHSSFASQIALFAVGRPAPRSVANVLACKRIRLEFEAERIPAGSLLYLAGMMTIDLERRLALVELLNKPDPPELKRGSRRCLYGKPDRFALLPILAAMFVQNRLLQSEERTMKDWAA